MRLQDLATVGRTGAISLICLDSTSAHSRLRDAFPQIGVSDEEKREFRYEELVVRFREIRSCLYHRLLDVRLCSGGAGSDLHRLPFEPMTVMPSTFCRRSIWLRRFPPTSGHSSVPRTARSCRPSVTTYAIFWVPAKLQNGGATSMTAHYQTVQSNLLRDYAGHGIDNNNTQYYQVTGTGTKQYIQNKGGFGGSFVDTDPYPASGCSDTATPGNCITDAQLETEVQKVMALKGWTGGLTKMFLVFTSSGEGSCFDSSGSSCAYAEYCAYHSFIDTSTPVVYGNEPFGNPSVCQAPGTPSPNADPRRCRRNRGQPRTHRSHYRSGVRRLVHRAGERDRRSLRLQLRHQHL